LNNFGRISLCGAITQYNQLDQPLEKGPNLTSLVGKQGKIEGFLVSRFHSKFPEAKKEMAEWMQQGKIKYRETIFEGFEKIPEAFVALFQSQNIGKILVKLD